MGSIASDVVGRRVLLIWGCAGQVLFLFLISGLGNASNPSTGDKRGLVASVVLYIFIFTGTLAPISYALASEIPTGALREKTMGLGIAVNVVAAFIVAFCVPYLLDAISVNIGWLFGGIALFTGIYIFFLVPETYGRSLEEMDELFAARISARKFRHTQTFGAGHRVMELENDRVGTDAHQADPGKDHVQQAEYPAPEKDVDRS